MAGKPGSQAVRFRYYAVTALTSAALIVALALGRSGSAQGHSDRAAAKAHTAAAKQFKVSIANTDFGSVGAKGHFSVKLGSSAHVIVAVLAAATGIPFAQIARGGSYIADIYSSGKGGMAVVKLSDHALGDACVKFTSKAGKYNPSLGYVPMSGSLTLVGGTKAAAHWRGTAKFKQTGLTGADTLQFDGSVGAKSEGVHGLTKACKAVERL